MMEFFDGLPVAEFAAIVWLDIVLSGDNALVIGLAASSLAPHLQRRAIIFGMTLAIVIRIAAALAASYLYEIPWLRFVGGLALLWVAWKLFDAVRHRALRALQEASQAVGETTGGGVADTRAVLRALGTIAVADIAMSVDNVLAVAGVAQDNRGLLVFGLALSIALMAFFATMICRLLTRYPWISYAGVAILVVVAGEMLAGSWAEVLQALGAGIP